MIFQSHPGRLQSAFSQHFRTISALMLRDIKTRVGSSYLGFCAGLSVPLFHIAIIMILYILMGRRSAIGTDVATYLATAIIPFIIWSYTHQKITYAFPQNSPLLSFPSVKLEDIIIARALVEAMNSTLILCVSVTFIIFFVDNFSVNNYNTTVLALFIAYFYGVSTGILVGLIGMMFPGFLLIAFLLIPITWITCGVFFIPSSLPAQMRYFLEFFPLSHVVDTLRVGFYSNYLSSFSNLNYVYTVIILNIISGLILVRIIRATYSTR